MNLEMTMPRDVLPMLGRWVRMERQRANWTLGDLAARSGVPSATISRLERLGLASTDAVLRVLFALDKLEAFYDFLKERMRLASFPLTLGGAMPHENVKRVRHRKEAS